MIPEEEMRSLEGRNISILDWRHEEYSQLFIIFIAILFDK